MNTAPILRTSLVALSFTCTSAQAEWRCDCTTILDTCSAAVTVEDNSISIESDHLQCARVDYLVDGLPFVALVVDGRERQSWLSRNDNPRVLMQSCQVCLDNAVARTTSSGAAPVERPGALSPDTELAWLLSVDPQYPSAAVASGLEGFVEVRYTVTALGRVEQATVTAAEPPGVFEQAALSAISRWRYAADEGRAAVALSHRFEFKREDATRVAAVPSGGTAEHAIDALIARSAAHSDGGDAEPAPTEPSFPVRNHCIREQLTYDFGELVEASLMNTCDEPLLVYSCAEGVGRYQHHWVCQSSEIARSILVRPGDRLAGNTAMVVVPEGIRTYKYAEDFFLARARHSEYWWLACGVNDDDCRGSGRMWARSMNGKQASVDPQVWTEQRVARSY